MNRNLKIFFAAILVAGVFTQDRICEHLGFGQNKYHQESVEAKHRKELIVADSSIESDYLITETVYRWEERLMDWVVDNDMEEPQAQLVNQISSYPPLSTPIEVDWKVLMEIQYKLRYYAEIELELYAPIFSEAVEALHGKEVVLEGFVIPLDEEEELLSLSFNPYSSCFFCGKASPASVISMYLKEEAKRYKIDDFKKFSGTLYLNYDDPNEFYYVLRDAQEVK